MAFRVSDTEFDVFVDDALEMIPDELARRMVNLVILVRERNEDNPSLLGLYEGVALPERTFDHTGFLPDTISIYKAAIEDICVDRDELAREVTVTVLHEVGHYFGMDEATLHAFGWG